MQRLAFACVFAAALPATAQTADPVTVAVLDRAVDKGQLLSVDDFTAAQTTYARARGALRVRDAAGMEAGRRLEPGAVVRSSDIVRPQLIRRGETVTVTVRDLTLSITTQGRALGSGALGDQIRVVTLSTNRTLVGVVEAAGSVRVGTN